MPGIQYHLKQITNCFRHADFTLLEITCTDYFRYAGFKLLVTHTDYFRHAGFMLLVTRCTNSILATTADETNNKAALLQDLQQAVQKT